VSSPNVKAAQDQVGVPPKLEAFLANIYRIIDGAVLGMTSGQQARLEDLRSRWQAEMDAWDRLVAEQVAGFSDAAGPAVLVPEIN